mgnify:CR=1 FL=1
MEALERQRKALELCLAGANYVQIAQAIGYKSTSGAYMAVQAALKLTLQPMADQVRQKNVERLNRLRMANWPKAVSGDGKAIEVELHLQEREARYLGLDRQPTDDAAKQTALAAAQINVLIQVDGQNVSIGEWRRKLLETGNGRSDTD